MSNMKIGNSQIPLHKNVSPDQQDKQIRDAAKMYEKYFLNEMVKAMRKTVDHSELTKPTFAQEIYTGQLDQNTVEAWGDKGGVGLADLIYNQIQERYFNRMHAPHPQGPIQLDKSTIMKIDETRQYGIPATLPKTQPGEDLSLLFEFDAGTPGRNRDVRSPYAGEVIQSFRNEERQTVKIQHEDGLLSTISFIGKTKDLSLGDKLESGQVFGSLSPQAMGLTWQLGKIET